MPVFCPKVCAKVLVKNKTGGGAGGRAGMGEAGEIAQQFRVLAALVQNTDSVPSTHTVVQNICNSSSRRSDPFLASKGAGHVHGSHIHMQARYLYT